MDIKPVMAHKKKIVGGGIVAVIVALMMSISGCVATYSHKVMGDLASGNFEEVYKVDVQTDDFILEMRKLDKE